MAVQPYSATAPIKALAGSATAPGVTFVGDGDTGLYSPGANQVAVTTGGVQRLLIGSDGSITPSGSLLFPLGSAASPSVSFTGDPNTGLYSPGPDTVAISTNGTGRLFVDANGRVSVIKAGANDAAFTLGNGVASTFLTQSADGNFYQYNYGAYGLIFGTNATERMRLDSSGRLGLGTSSPNAFFKMEKADNTVYTSTGTSAWPVGANSPSLSILNAQAGVTGAAAHLGFGVSGASGPIQLAYLSAVSASAGSSPNIVVGQRTATGYSERLRIDSSGRVGIGTTAPTRPLTVNGSAFVNELRLPATDGNLTYDLNATDNGAAGTGALKFRRGNGVEVGRWDASGRLLVGTSTARAVGGTNRTVYIEGTTSETTGLAVIRNSNDSSGCSLLLAKTRGTSVGGTTAVSADDIAGLIQFLGTGGGTLTASSLIKGEIDSGTISSSSMPGRLVFSVTADGSASPTEALRITNDRYVRLASGTGGIQFNGDTAAANALDDYEEGTFTPTIVGTTTAGTGTYSIQVGVYTKVGDIIHYAITISWSAHTGTGNMRIDGLPFTARNLANYNPAAVLDVNNLTSPANTIVTAVVLANTTLIGINSVPVAGGARAALALDTAATIWASGSYAI